MNGAAWQSQGPCSHIAALRPALKHGRAINPRHGNILRIIFPCSWPKTFLHPVRTRCSSLVRQIRVIRILQSPPVAYSTCSSRSAKRTALWLALPAPHWISILVLLSGQDQITYERYCFLHAATNSTTPRTKKLFFILFLEPTNDLLVRPLLCPGINVAAPIQHA